MDPSPRVRVYLGCSLDGCIAGPEHDLSFLQDAAAADVAEAATGLGFEAFLEGIGAVLMARRTYEVPLARDLWPYGDRPVLVATHRPLPSAPQGGDARPVQGPIDRLIAEARALAGPRDVYLDGGSLVRDALDAGLVDSLCLTFLPVVLGQGIRLWNGLRSRTDLVFDAPALHGRGLVQVSARVRRSART